MKYDYVCQKCQNVHIHEQAMSDDTPLPHSIPCPECGDYMKYDVKQFGEAITVIPDHMRAGAAKEIDFGKLKREDRTFF